MDVGLGAAGTRTAPRPLASLRHGVTAPGTTVRDNSWSHAMLLVAVAAAIRLVFAALIPVLPDEAYYWVWSRHLAPGYFDHPYGVALLIRLGDVVLAPLGMAATPLAVRLGPVLAGWVASIATVGIA